MVVMPVLSQIKCLTFSHDGKFLGAAGKETHNREVVMVWDISRVSKGEKPTLIAK